MRMFTGLSGFELLLLRLSYKNAHDSLDHIYLWHVPQ